MGVPINQPTNQYIVCLKVQRYNRLVHKYDMECVVPENIHTSPTDGFLL